MKLIFLAYAVIAKQTQLEMIQFSSWYEENTNQENGTN